MSQTPEINLPKIGAAASAPSEVKRPPVSTEPTDQARLAEIETMMRELLRARRAEEQRPRSSTLALFATALGLAALLCSVGQAYYFWSAYERVPATTRDLPTNVNPTAPEENQADTRTQLTIPELARRSPSIRNGNIQAWWAGEQARQVQRLEAQAKRQTLAGDLEGAARSVSRADMIRGTIPALAESEKPLTH